MSIRLDSELGKKIAASKVIAVLVIDEVADAVPTAQALLRGGVDMMELTLRTPAALAGLRAVCDEVPEMAAGIGTIITRQQVDDVCEAGAAFGVAPGVNVEVIRYAQDQGLAFGPGVMTPTDIDQSVALGCEVLKFFPAGSSGGLAHLKNIAAPYQHLGLQFIPLGGIKAANMVEYLDSPLVIAIGGSWIAPRELIAAKNWDQIEANAREARELCG